MWKIALGFIGFAALSVFLLMKSGSSLDMSGEKHGIEVAEHAASAPVSK